MQCWIKKCGEDFLEQHGGGEAGESTQQDPNQRFHRTPQADRVLDSDKIDVRSINVVTDNVVEVYFKTTDEDDLPTVYMNIFLACFTTCWVRLHLKHLGVTTRTMFSF